MNKLNKYVSAFLLLTLIITPSFALAKNEKNTNSNSNKISQQKQEREREREREEEREESLKSNKNTKKCFQAWGHLIAPGWVKWNSTTTIPENCIIPFGIGKKFKGNPTATTTVDTTGPVISNIVVTPNRYSATITWKTDELSDSKVFYSTSSPIDFNNALSKTNGSMTKNHSINISGLSSSTNYYIAVQSKDSSGNTGTSSTISFTTLAPLADTVPPTISNVIATVGTTTINVGWKTNESATSKIYYSTSSPVNLSTSTSVENNSLITNHLVSLYSLSTSTTYYVILESKDTSGNTQRTDEFSVVTTSGL